MFRKKMVVRVNGMSCEHCANAIKEELSKNEVIKVVKVNLKNKKVTISHIGNLNVHDVKKSITGLGYEFIGVE